MGNPYEEVWERDAGRCQNCGGAGHHVHHIKFRSQGGPNEPWNLILLCKRCHDLAHGLGGKRIPPAELHQCVEEGISRMRLLSDRLTEEAHDIGLDY